MWRDLILAMDPDAEFHSPASAEQLLLVDSVLDVHMPGELFSLLRESNGVEVSFGTHLIWSTDNIVEHNMQMRAESRAGGEMGRYMPINHLLFFGEASNGDLYAFPITSEGVSRRIFVWDHEDDSRTCEAGSLEDWFASSPKTQH